MQTLMFCLVFCLTLSTAAAADKIPADLFRDYDLVKMEQTLALVKTRSEVPSVSNQNAMPFSEMQYEAPATIRDLFFGLQKEIFGKVLISLKFCSDCYFEADIIGKNLYLDPSVLEQILNSKEYNNPLELVKFIFAHELSHFVQELSAHPPYSKVDNWTDSGFPSYFFPFKSAEEADAINSDKNFVQSHVEVDIYALLILKKLNFSNWNDVFLLFEVNLKMLQSDPDFDEVSTNDILVRRITLKKLLGIK